MKLHVLILTSLLPMLLLAQDVYEGIDYTQPDVSEETFSPIEKSKSNIIGKSWVELGFNSAGSGTMTTLSYVVHPKLLVGIASQNFTNINHTSGGDLDNGQYYSSSYGYSSKAVFAGAKYFIKDHGIQAHGLFFAGQVGRSWGKYQYSKDRFERENGFLGTIFGVDKKLVESSSDEAIVDSNIYRATIGYTLPFVDGILIKGVSLQFQAGIEQNSLPENKYLTTKFDTKNVGADIKSNMYLDIGVMAYF